MDGVCSVETHPVEGRFLVREDIVFQEILCSAEGNVSEISICVCVFQNGDCSNFWVVSFVTKVKSCPGPLTTMIWDLSP